MTSKMKQKIDAVLDRVKEPVTGLPVAQLGLVERLRYSESKKKLFVFLNAENRRTPKCCKIIQGLLLSDILKALTEEFNKEFPELSIEIVRSHFKASNSLV
jgi:metal-sulfur cluster biosynthetic enzyme